MGVRSARLGPAALLARRRLKAAPDDQDALRLAARATARQGGDQVAIATYARLELKRMTAEDYFLLGRALSRTGQDDLALKSLEAARDADPDRLETLDELAQVCYRKGRPAAAEELARRLLATAGPGSPGAIATRDVSRGAARSDRGGACLETGVRARSRRPGRRTPPVEAAPPALGAFLAAIGPTGRGAAGARGDPGVAIGFGVRVALEPLLPPGTRLAPGRRGAPRPRAPIAATIPSSRSPPRTSARRSVPGVIPPTYEAVRTSRHSATFAARRNARSLPLPDRPFPDPGDPKVQHRYERRDDGIHVETRVGDQVFRALARYAFGSPDRYVTLTGLDEQGRSRLMRMSYFDSTKGTGWDVSTGLPPHPARPDQFLGELADPGDGERRCLDCHTTNFRAIEDNVGPESADPAMGCERCHGPGGHHVLAVEGEFPKREIISPGLRPPRDGQPTLRLLPRPEPAAQPSRRTGRPGRVPIPGRAAAEEPLLRRQRRPGPLRHLPRPAQERRDRRGAL